MSSPLWAPEPRNSRKNWFERYLAVEGIYTRRIAVELVAAAGSAEAIVRELDMRSNISSRVNRLQLNVIRHQIYRLLQHLYVERASPLIAQGKLNAVEAATLARLQDDRRVLRALYPDPDVRAGFEKAQIAKARRNIDSMLVRILHTNIPLSRRVYKTRDLSRGYVDRTINSGLARGDSAVDIAKRVRDSIRPDVPGGVSYAAMRLARTEINNAFHAQAIADAMDNPWVESVEWKLSAVHADDPDDMCEIYAEIGTFDVRAVPKKPHPNCRCFIVPKTIEWDEFEANLVAGFYDDMGEAGAA